MSDKNNMSESIINKGGSVENDVNKESVGLLPPTPPKKNIFDCRIGLSVSLERFLEIAKENSDKILHNAYEICLDVPVREKHPEPVFVDKNDLPAMRDYIKDKNIEVYFKIPKKMRMAMKELNHRNYVKTFLFDNMVNAVAIGARGCIVNPQTYWTSTYPVVLQCIKKNLEYCLDEFIKTNPPYVPYIIFDTACKSENAIPLFLDEAKDVYDCIEDKYKQYIKFSINTNYIFVKGMCDLNKPDKVDDYLKTCEEDLGWDKIVLIHAYNTHSKFNYKTYKNIPLSVNGRISKQGMDRIIAMGIGTGKTIISSI